MRRRQTKEVHSVNPNGIALGFASGKFFQTTIAEQRIQLQQGDRVLLYTDGVNEAMNEKKEQFGMERIYEVLQRYAHISSEDILRALIASLEKFKGRAPQHDDITLVTFRIV
jgi:serine phosphatase RsbU (regulator of sigma subunit)